MAARLLHIVPGVFLIHTTAGDEVAIWWPVRDVQLELTNGSSHDIYKNIWENRG